MPTYEYQCDACNHRFEKFQSITAAPIKKCPKCGKSKVRRLIGTGAGVLFKGSGFYITDYRPDSYNKAAKADAPGGGSSTNGEAAKPASSETPPTPAKSDAAKPAAESKPAPKKESKPTKKS
ncbi:MAG TPA: FmdB family zinc ribbon protein [Tepidisphaeraceae bacterium]|jgi:putative FmdB family regulatory protein